MNIVVLSGSPRKGANTDTMVEAFAETAREGGHDAAIAMYKSACAYCKWENQGIVTISGMTERDSMASSPKLEEVREFARKLA